MKHEKPLSNWKSEISALQSDEPRESAVDRAVFAMQAPAAKSAKAPKMIWRGVGLAAGVTAVGLGITLMTPSASAAGLTRVSNAVKAQKNRHDRAFRPDKHGNLVMTNEDWIEGEKQAMNMFDADGNKSVILFDGSRSYISYPNEESWIDDTDSCQMPMEDLAAYLNIPNGKVTNHTTSGTTETYSMEFVNMKMDIHIDPSTELPTGREVYDKQGNLIERNEYDYPADIADSIFEIPSGNRPNNYPVLRSILAKQLLEAGQSKQGISLKAVIVGPHKVLALWTGGAMGEHQDGAVMSVDGASEVNVCARPEAFSKPNELATSYTQPKPIMAGNEPLRGDGVWLTQPLQKGPLTIEIPVWAEDKTRPLILKNGQNVGYHSKMVGRVKFEVKNPILAADPDRLLWKPVSGATAVTTGQ